MSNFNITNSGELQAFMSELNKVVQALPGFEQRLATLTPVQKQVQVQSDAKLQAQAQLQLQSTMRAQSQLQAQANIAASFQSGPSAGPTTVPVDMITTNDELANPNIIVVGEITVPH